MSVEIQRLIEQLVARQDLTREETGRAFQIMMNGGATPAQIAAFLIGLRMKGEKRDEITGAAETMRHKALDFTAPDNAIDTCGTGGDALGTYNISTAVALVVAACNVPVVKHGNRSVSSKSGSSQVLQELLVDVNAPAEIMRQALEEVNLCFLMAPGYHKAMRHLAPIRQELKLRTIFNLLGPLSNPAGVKRQLLGVYDRALVPLLAEVLRDLGAVKAWVVHGADGLDEISLTGPTYIAKLENGRIEETMLHPEDAGLAPCRMDALIGGSPEENAAALKHVLLSDQGAYRDIVLLNSAAALMIADACENLPEGIAMAAEAIDSGKAHKTLMKFAEITQQKDAA
jgi:anthranilate phosphoribosyltransferase